MQGDKANQGPIFKKWDQKVMLTQTKRKLEFPRHLRNYTQPKKCLFFKNVFT